MSQTHKLSNAPLQEVIFELLWEIGIDQSGNPLDHGFELAQGLFARKVSKSFPVYRRTIPEGSLIKMYPKTIHQFWKEESTWPVVQLGPGILAINDTDKKYEWKSSFFPLIKDHISILEDCYDNNLIYKSSSLRYIDAVEINPDDRVDLLRFINKNFNIFIKNNYEMESNLVNLGLSQTFEIDEETKVNISLNDGMNKQNKPSLIWQTYIFTNHKKNKNEVISWTERAHNVTSKLFVDLLNKDFYASFK